jgi:xanthine/CO dehydrogenase XdhC/CoxF family maturation factor
VVELQSIVQSLTGPATTYPCVLATLVAVEGSSYRRAGARLLIKPDGERLGSISGGCLEEDLVARAGHVRESGRAELVTYDTTSENDLVWGVGLGCNGIVRVLLEQLAAPPGWAAVLAANFHSNLETSLAVVWGTDDKSRLGTRLGNETPALPPSTQVFIDNVPPPIRLFVLGAGDDAKPLVRLGKGLGWHVVVGDPRPAFATTFRFPDADGVIVAPSAALIDRLSPPSDALAVIMTHHYIHDVPLLRDLLPRSLRYIGLLGPKKRAAKIISDLRNQGSSFTPEQLQRLHAPVGLDLGAETPEEVALSIVSEIRATLAQRDARPLRDRDRPIHG